MTKRHVTMIQQVYAALLSDCCDNLPMSVADRNRDFSRLCSAVEDRGLSFFTIDLVSMGKHFDLCLSTGRLTLSGLPHMRAFRKGTVIPRLFKGLLLRVFDIDGSLLPVPCLKSIAYLRQLYKLCKRLKLECEKERTYETVRSFFRTDVGTLSGSLSWGSCDLGSGRACHLDFDDKLRSDPKYRNQLSFDFPDQPCQLPRDTVRAIHFCADYISTTLGIYNPYGWRSKHGPGAVSDRVGKSKYDFPTWPMKLDSIYPIADFAFANYANWADEVASMTSHLRGDESPSKLIAVPKTMAAPRLIASEPTSHQWCQQNIKDFIYTRVRESWIGRSVHFRDQTFNQNLARQASQSQSHWTIDLSEASDRVSCYVVERVFRKNPFLLDAFNACRTQLVSNDINPYLPRLHSLRKFACMGSALTFPVQSLVFLSIVLGSMLSHRNLRYSQRNVRDLAREVLVFGDDLIVPDDCGHLVLGSLRYLGFKVNHFKTFGKGKFRESCGGEYYDGYDVTPSYLLSYPVRSRPDSMISTVAVRNNFYKRGYFRAAEAIKSTVVNAGLKSVATVAVGSGDFGWESYEGADFTGLKSRFNKDLHFREYWVSSISSSVTKSPDRYTSRVLQYFTEAPPPTVLWEGGVPERPTLNLKRRWVGLSN